MGETYVGEGAVALVTGDERCGVLAEIALRRHGVERGVGTVDGVQDGGVLGRELGGIELGAARHVGVGAEGHVGEDADGGATAGVGAREAVHARAVARVRHRAAGGAVDEAPGGALEVLQGAAGSAADTSRLRVGLRFPGHQVERGDRVCQLKSHEGSQHREEDRARPRRGRRGTRAHRHFFSDVGTRATAPTGAPTPDASSPRPTPWERRIARRSGRGTERADRPVCTGRVGE